MMMHVLPLFLASLTHCYQSFGYVLAIFWLRSGYLLAICWLYVGYALMCVVGGWRGEISEIQNHKYQISNMKSEIWNLKSQISSLNS